MDPLSLTGTLIAVIQITTSVISVCYDYRAGVASASRDAIQITDSLNALKDVLEALLRLVEKSRSAGKSARLVTVEGLSKEGGTLESCQKELVRLKAQLEPESGWRKVRRSLVWPLKEGEMKKALAVLERYKSTMQLAVSADQATLSLAIKDDLEDLSARFQKHTFGIDALSTPALIDFYTRFTYSSSTDQTHQDIFRWLAAPDPFVNHNLNRKKRQGSTGTWLLTSKQYDSWLYGRDSFFWLYGIPGCGKTVLCSTVVDQLIHYTQQVPSTALAYFYFDFNDAQKRGVSSVVRSLIDQLSSHYPSLPSALAELYEARRNSRRTIDDEALLSALRSVILLFNNIYLIFDALDESSNSEDTLNFIRRLKEWGIPQLHILVTSRNLAELEEFLLPLTSVRICLHETLSNNDIKIYLADKFEHDQKLSKWPPDIRKQITVRLIQGEQGMFQWVVCQLEMLQKCLSVAAVRKALSADFPTDLAGTYDQILLGIQQSYQLEALKTLQALVATYEPLTFEEIVDILAVDLESAPPRFEPDARLVDPRSILSVCSSLTTTAKMPLWDIRGQLVKPTTILRLAHASVAEYFNHPKPPGLSQFQFSKDFARRMLGQTCLAYLMAPEFSNVKNKKRQIRANMELYPFLRHAVLYWPLYLERDQGDPSGRMDEASFKLAQAFLATSKMPNGGNFTFWVGMLIPEAPIQHITNTQPLYYAASYGILEVVRLLLDTEKDVDIDALGGRARSSALHVATFRDHIEVVQLLLARGADPNLPNSEGESPLYWAVINDNDEMVDLLLENGGIALPFMPNPPSHDDNLNPIPPVFETLGVVAARGS